MKVTTLVFAVALSILLGSIIFAVSHPKSATAFSASPPLATTGAPTEGTCVSCHTGTSGHGTLAMALSDFQTTYIPGQTDTLVIGIGSPAGASRWGFELTVLKNSDNTMAGTLAPVADLATQLGTASSGGRTYIGHRSNGAIAPFDTNDGTEWGYPVGGWLVEWTAPGPGSGPVTFYASGIAADGQENAGATDTTYTATLTVTEQGSSPVTSTTWGKIKKKYQ